MWYDGTQILTEKRVNHLRDLIFFILVIEMAIVVYYSFRARRQRDGIKRGIYFARMNIMIGVLFLTLAFTQLFFSPYNFLLIAFAIGVLLIGLYNLYVGIRNHGMFTRMLK